MYTIYYGTKPSGDDKIGCDHNYPNRPIEQGLTNYYVLETHKDIKIASAREIKLQLEYFGKRDSNWSYEDTKKFASKASKNSLASKTHNFFKMTFEERSANSKKYSKFYDSEFQSMLGKRNKGKPAPHSSKLAKALNVEWTCEHCDKTGRGKGNFKRWGHHDGSCVAP